MVNKMKIKIEDKRNEQNNLKNKLSDVDNKIMKLQNTRLSIINQLIENGGWLKCVNDLQLEGDANETKSEKKE